MEFESQLSWLVSKSYAQNTLNIMNIVAQYYLLQFSKIRLSAVAYRSL